MLALFVTSLLAVPAMTHAECTYPKAPDSVPDGKSASEAEMVAAMQAFKQFNSDVTAYLACVDSEADDQIKGAGGSSSTITLIKSMQTKKHNSAVDELQALAGKFNEQVRIFKSSHK